MKQVFGVFFDRGERAYETRLQLADVTFAMFLYMAWGYVIRLKDDSQIGQRCVRFFFFFLRTIQPSSHHHLQGANSLITHSSLRWTSTSLNKDIINTQLVCFVQKRTGSSLLLIFLCKSSLDLKFGIIWTDLC